MASFVFNQAKLSVLDGTIDLSTDSFYAVLVTATPTSGVTQKAGLTEATGGNYTPQDLTGQSLALNSSTVELTFVNPIWNSLTTTSGAILGVVICKGTAGATAGTDEVLAFLEFTASYTPSGATFQVTATGNVYLSLT